jgi:cysteine synthase A
MACDRLVGNTPIINVAPNVWAKMEAYNPTGSIKDRMVNYVLARAIRENKIKKGDTVIEATSGNTGISLSFFGQIEGLNVKIIMPSNMSEERKKMMRYFGAEIIEVDPGDFEGAIAVRDRMAIDNAWYNFNQFHEPLNIECHYVTTGNEIVRQIEDIFGFTEYCPTLIEAIVLGTGTGGTLMGAGKRIKENYPNAKIVAVEPAESPVMSGGKEGLHGIQGIGDGSKFLVDLDKVDEIITISTKEAEEKAIQLAKKGFFVGISSGANVLAAEKWVKKNNPRGSVVTILCDRGERYMSIL